MPVFDPQIFVDAGFGLNENVPLSELGTFQLGGPARYVITLSTPDALRHVRTLCREQDLPALLIGEGSNVLFSDAGWPGLLVRYTSGQCDPVDLGQGIFRCNAATNLNQLVIWAAEKGWAGLEAFSGIPGTLGGAVVGNAGAWGVQMEHVLHRVQVIDAEGQGQIWSGDDCGFSYRDSTLKHSGLWVAEVDIQLRPGDRMHLLAEHQRILALRAARHPDWKQLPCIGSFFKNLEPSSAAERRQAAGYFLEAAGAKNIIRGGAGVFSGHANILVKQRGDCKAADVAALARELQIAVRAQFGIDLVREVRYLGQIPGEEAGVGFY
jgi:UDP-N-acetylmuramate dehydrogenase